MIDHPVHWTVLGDPEACPVRAKKFNDFLARQRTVDAGAIKHFGIVWAHAETIAHIPPIPNRFVLRLMSRC